MYIIINPLRWSTRESSFVITDSWPEKLREKRFLYLSRVFQNNNNKSDDDFYSTYSSRTRSNSPVSPNAVNSLSSNECAADQRLPYWPLPYTSPFDLSFADKLSTATWHLGPWFSAIQRSQAHSSSFSATSSLIVFPSSSAMLYVWPPSFCRMTLEISPNRRLIIPFSSTWKDTSSQTSNFQCLVSGKLALGTIALTAGTEAGLMKEARIELISLSLENFLVRVSLGILLLRDFINGKPGLMRRMRKGLRLIQ